ncbi:hypothetical protein HAX54_002456 [Datura stramonium]|uniref:Uncharacterized protein n=1 Tax=Datura stramonium TaxID=4076 RepID=A0ABS8RT33_DATST|nr:hypothetical protein [Datura stramonium]
MMHATLKAEDILNSWPADEVGRVLREYGEESNWYSLQNRIVKACLHGGLHSTNELVDLIQNSTSRTKGGFLFQFEDRIVKQAFLNIMNCNEVDGGGVEDEEGKRQGRRKINLDAVKEEAWIKQSDSESLKKGDVIDVVVDLEGDLRFPEDEELYQLFQHLKLSNHNSFLIVLGLYSSCTVVHNELSLMKL